MTSGATTVAAAPICAPMAAAMMLTRAAWVSPRAENRACRRSS
ncbi:hypothetical protein [Teichococcus aerofrigidensis]